MMTPKEKSPQRGEALGAKRSPTKGSSTRTRGMVQDGGGQRAPAFPSRLARCRSRVKLARRPRPMSPTVQFTLAGLRKSGSVWLAQAPAGQTSSATWAR